MMKQQNWFSSPYTGLFLEAGSIPRRAYDPDVSIHGGTIPGWGRAGDAAPIHVGGAGWDDESAELACVGEGIERLQPYRLPRDKIHRASFQDWKLNEPAVDPSRWVLFHADQYAQLGFPFRPLNASYACDWICFREARSGKPYWVPEELAMLALPAHAHEIAPGVSTGFACGRTGYDALLRGLQEVIERDAVVGAWWESYPLEEHAADAVLRSLDPSIPPRILRPNLRYRFYRVASPYSSHVTVVTMEGEDREGFCFSIGSACRETRSASWEKSIIEAVSGRHFVRYIRSSLASDENESTDLPGDFDGHAMYYSLHPEKLAQTVLHHPREISRAGEGGIEDFGVLAARLGPDRPVLFRNMTPPGIAQEVGDWYVLKVLVPGLQPLHGSHYFPQLGGPLWKPRRLADWANIPPHPFP